MSMAGILANHRSSSFVMRAYTQEKQVASMIIFEQLGAAWMWSLGGFLLLWLLSVVKRDASVVDFWWGPGFAVMALVFWHSIGMPMDFVSLVLLGVICLWGARLGLQLSLRRLREGEEDARYQELRAKFGAGWPVKSLFVVFLLQAVLQGVIASGVLVGLASVNEHSIQALVFLGAALSLAGVALQTVSDTQLDKFKSAHPQGGLLTTGLREYVRFPSYLGEIMVWAGLALISLSFGNFWALGSLAIVTGLLVYVSGVTILDDRLARTRPDYKAFTEKTPALVPANWKAGLSRSPN